MENLSVLLTAMFLYDIIIIGIFAWLLFRNSKTGKKTKIFISICILTTILNIALILGNSYVYNFRHNPKDLKKFLYYEINTVFKKQTSVSHLKTIKINNIKQKLELRSFINKNKGKSLLKYKLNFLFGTCKNYNKPYFDPSIDGFNKSLGFPRQKFGIKHHKLIKCEIKFKFIPTKLYYKFTKTFHIKLKQFRFNKTNTAYIYFWKKSLKIYRKQGD